MTVESNKELVHRYVEEGVNAGNMAVLDALFDPDFVNHDPAQPNVRDLVGLKQFWMAQGSAFPDMRTTIEDLVAEGDRVVKRFTWRGTQTGDWAGIPASGKQVVLEGIDILRVSNGKIKEIWWGYDVLGVIQQLSARPAAQGTEG